jgi:hypothetical protein
VQDIVEYAYSNDNDLDLNQLEQSLKNVFPESEIKIMTSVMLKDIKAEGRAEGITEGEARGKIEIILRVLTRRLGNVSEFVRDQLYGIKDVDLLDELADVALDCQTLAEFENRLVK